MAQNLDRGRQAGQYERTALEEDSIAPESVKVSRDILYDQRQDIKYPMGHLACCAPRHKRYNRENSSKLCTRLRPARIV